MDKEELENLFTYHTPVAGDIEKYIAIREWGFNLANTIVNMCPPCADTTAAVRKVREAVMTANAAIACNRR